MHNVIVAGAGKIGRTIAYWLAKSGQYKIYLADTHLPEENHLPTHPNLHTEKLNVTDAKSVNQFLQKHPCEAVVSCLPYFCNKDLAKIAKKEGLYYFDLTEDVETTKTIKHLAKEAPQAFVSQCGLAPGFIDIVANDLMQHFEALETVKLRCGALPETTSNALRYALTWSVDGLINEYGNPCPAIVEGKQVMIQPLEGLEELQIDGHNYEAFNTSGGIATLTETYKGKVETLNYKTIRYPGHREKMRFLMQDLKLNHDRNTLKQILLNALPHTTQDVVIIYVSVNGTKYNEFCKESYVKKFYPLQDNHHTFTAIQCTTALSACAVIDIVLQAKEKYHGFIHQEQFSLNDILENRFGEYFKTPSLRESTSSLRA